MVAFGACLLKSGYQEENWHARTSLVRRGGKMVVSDVLIVRYGLLCCVKLSDVEGGEEKSRN